MSTDVLRDPAPAPGEDAVVHGMYVVDEVTVGDRVVVLLGGQVTGRAVVALLSPVGRDVLTLTQGGSTLGELTDRLVAAYGAPQDDALGHVRGFVESLAEQGVVVVQQPVPRVDDPPGGVDDPPEDFESGRYAARRQ